MRIYLSLTKNKEIIPYNYQHFLTGAIHKWIGNYNKLHDNMSLYSFSWLQNVRPRNKYGINFTADSYFFISAHQEDLVKKIVNGIMADPHVCFGASVSDIQIAEDQQFSGYKLFHVASPVLVKRTIEQNEKHFTYDDSKCTDYLTETLQKKLRAASISAEGIRVRFDAAYPNSQTKIIYYKEIGNRVNICPIVIEGTPEQLQFAWNVGVGNSTGIGFGALK